ncbi:MAG: histidine phosphatase family protein [Patescibacteria group bacterium]
MTVEKTIYFVRHGQSEANIAVGVSQPLDSPLTPKGKEQAGQVAERVGLIAFDLLVCSTLIRAKQTCEAITTRTGKEPVYSELFVERREPAELAGKSRDDTETSELWEAWNENLYTPGSRVSNGENFDDFMERADAALEYLQGREEETILVVTHGRFLRALLARVLLGPTITGESFRSFQSNIETQNTGLSVLKYGQHRGAVGWYVWIYNDHAHLG